MAMVSPRKGKILHLPHCFGRRVAVPRQSVKKYVPTDDQSTNHVFNEYNFGSLSLPTDAIGTVTRLRGDGAARRSCPQFHWLTTSQR